MWKQYKFFIGKKMEQKMQTVTMTAEELESYNQFKATEGARIAAERAKAEREVYKTLVDDTINRAMPILQSISADIANTKQSVIDEFRTALEIKGNIFGVVEGQKAHTFTNAVGNMRITLGQYYLDDYRDTVNEGIAIVKEYIESLAKDEDSRALVSAVLRLMSRDNAGNLKASRVLQLRRMAEESGNERFLEGVKIIEESYQPTASKQFVRAEIKTEHGAWVAVPLGMTEA